MRIKDIIREANYGRYYCSTDKKWKTRKGPKQTRASESVAEATWINGKKQDDKELVWKQTGMSYEEACKKYGKENCRLGGKNKLGQQTVEVHVPLVAEGTEYGIPDSTPGHLPGGPKMTFGEFKKLWPGVILKRPSGGSLAGSVVADVEGWMNNPKSVWEPLDGVEEGLDFARLERLDPQSRRVLSLMADHAQPGSWLSAEEAYAIQLGLQRKKENLRAWEQEVKVFVDLYKEYSKKGVAEGTETAADIDKMIEFHKQGQRAAQYKGSMNKMHAAKIRELEAKKKALQGVAEGFNGISVDIEPELDYDVVYVDINGKRYNFNYWYSEEKPTDELGFRKDIPQYLKREEWYNKLDFPTKMEVLHAVVQAELGNEPSEYKPTVGDEPLDEEKQRLDPKCWDGYKKKGTKIKGGVRVNNCVKVSENEYTLEGEVSMWYDDALTEAEYQGRKVPLGKPMQGDVKKFKVYVKNEKGNVVKVNFGDPDMKIKKSNPARRKSFRARHNCDNPGPRTKARYWSCRKW